MGMDYEALSAKELQNECARRGLASARAAKPVMVQRLLDDDANTPDTAGGVTAAPAGPAGVPALLADGEYVLAPSVVASEPAAPGAFRLDFPAEPGGPDEETHLAYRTATLQAAADAGWQTRGDGHLAATVDGRWVYEVAVRRPR
jgi:hypothetical protein